jgi:hypothetical protein
VSREKTRQAVAAYRDLGWPTEQHGDGIHLITGTAIDALEVPSAAGVLAAAWWRCGRGEADPIRHLPAMPDPRQALVLIAAGDSYFFVTRGGDCPWKSQDPVTTGTTARPSSAVIRWHSRGSRIAAPADGVPRGQRQQAEGVQPVWVDFPEGSVRLASPAELLHLLMTATAATRLGPHMLILGQGVLAIPVLGKLPDGARGQVRMATVQPGFRFKEEMRGR